MICFLPVVRMKELGKKYDLVKFNEATEDLNSVDKLTASAFFRFAMDAHCPALFVLIPKEGDEQMPGLRWLADFDQDRMKALGERMFSVAVDNFGTDKVSWYTLNDRVILLVKNDFENGEWVDYGYELTGKDGVSVPC